VLRSLAVSAKCIAIASSGFSGGAVMSIAGCFGDGSGEDKVGAGHRRPWASQVSPWNCA
jgi:hypothetical protein